jgi:hypothetical protein
MRFSQSTRRIGETWSVLRMAKSAKKQSNELEFQGQVVSWLNEYIGKHSGIGLNTAKQEKPHKTSDRL